MSLSNDEILELLRQESTPRRGGGGRKKRDDTEPREYSTWWKLDHHLGTSCQNPDCTDRRELNDLGRNLTAHVKDHDMCRYCFLAGWLSDDPRFEID